MPIDPNEHAEITGAMAWPCFGANGCDASYLGRLMAAVDARADLADHQLMLLLKTWLECAQQLPPLSQVALKASVTGFRYSLDEPGTDSMCSWTESHYLGFATCEYLASQLFPLDIFGNDGQRGRIHRHRAELRLRVWLDDRFRWGFSEWLSSSYCAVNTAALTLLVDYAGDAELARRAGVVLDLLLLDMALHRFDGHFVAASARASALPLQQLDRAATQPIVDDAFGAAVPDVATDELGAIFVSRRRYVVPAALMEIAHSDDVFRIRTSQGLDITEVRETLASDPVHPRVTGEEQLPFWWSMQAFTAPDIVQATVAKYTRAHLKDNEFLAQLGGLARVPRPLRNSAVRLTHPTVEGMAVQRGNVQTFRTPYYLLSSAQRYHPGEFGDQQHLWQACLPGGISVFGNHIATSTLHTQTRLDSPAGWVGNGINPDIAQVDDVLLVQYDLRGRQGRFEGPRQLFTHIYFPFVDFDESRVGIHWVAGRRGGSYIGILSTSPLDLMSESEIVQRGVRTGYGVICADEREFGSLTGFIRQLKEYWISLRGGLLRLATSYGVYELAWGGDFSVNHEKIGHDYPRYSSHVVEAARRPTVLRVEGSRHRLRLDWAAGTRLQSPKPDSTGTTSQP